MKEMDSKVQVKLDHMGKALMRVRMCVSVYVCAAGLCGCARMGTMCVIA